jgi:hypothetical protein
MIAPFRMGLRDFEVYKFNNTIVKSGETKLFTYFWRIEKLKSKLKSSIESLTSPTFSISGLSLRVKATLNHLKRDYIYLQLEQLPTNEESTPNVVLESGNLFKDIETKKFFRHKIVILNQVRAVYNIYKQTHLLLDCSRAFLSAFHGLCFLWHPIRVFS